MEDNVIKELEDKICQQETEISKLKSKIRQLKKKSKPYFFDLLNKALANMPGYIYWKNKDLEYMGCNNNLAKVSGLNDRSEIIGKTDYDFEWGKEQADHFRKDDEEVMRDQIIKITEHKMPIKRSDGKYYFVRTEKIPLYENDSVIGVLGVAVDITDQEDEKKSIVHSPLNG